MDVTGIKCKMMVDKNSGFCQLRGTPISVLNSEITIDKSNWIAILKEYMNKTWVKAESAKHKILTGTKKWAEN